MSKEKPLVDNLSEWFRKGSNILSLTALIISLVIGGVALYHDYSPSPRAGLTILLSHYVISYTSGSNQCLFDVLGTIANNGSLTATILECDLFLNVNTSYEILDYRYSVPKMTLGPAEQTDFTIGRTLIGKNDTMFRDTAITGCVITVWFEDSVGMQVTKKEYAH
jgi:hypothetical protein